MNSPRPFNPGKTPYYAGAAGRQVQIRAVVKRLTPGHPELQEGGGFIASAAQYLLADRQPLNDGRVLEEARRRKAYFDRCMADNAAKRA